MRLFANLAAYLPEGASGDRAALEFPDGTTVGEVVEVLAIPSSLESLTVINGRDATPDQVLADGDVLSMFPPLAGGAS